MGEWLPVILIIFDAREDVAYWVYIQAYFQRIASFNLALVGESTTVRIQKSDLVDTAAMRLFARYKAAVLRQRPEKIHYDAY